MLMMKMLMQDENYDIFLVDCCVMLSGELPQPTAGHALRNYSNELIFELREREIPPAVEIVAIVDCSLPPPIAHDLSAIKLLRCPTAFAHIGRGVLAAILVR